jgi:hypothetical protein
MDSDSECSPASSETEFAATSVHGGPFRDDPVWDPALASACDIQGSIFTGGYPVFYHFQDLRIQEPATLEKKPNMYNI